MLNPNVKMLPNGRAAGTTIPQTDSGTQVIYTTEAGKAAALRAVQRIDAMYNAYEGAGGIRDMLSEVNRKVTSISSEIFAVAMDAVGLAGNNLAAARNVFLALCAGAEGHLQTRLRADETSPLPKMTEILPAWPQYKSRIAAYMSRGINPADHYTAPQEAAENYSPLGAMQRADEARQKLIEEKQRAKTGAEQEATAETESRSPQHAVLARPSAGWSTRLQSVMLHLQQQLRLLKSEDEQDEAARILSVALHQIRKIGEDSPGEDDESLHAGTAGEEDILDLVDETLGEEEITLGGDALDDAILADTADREKA